MTATRTIIPNHNSDLYAVDILQNTDVEPPRHELYFTPVVAWLIGLGALENLPDETPHEQCMAAITVDPGEQPVHCIINRATGDWWMLGDGSGKGEETLLKILTERAE